MFDNWQQWGANLMASQPGSSPAPSAPMFPTDGHGFSGMINTLRNRVASGISGGPGQPGDPNLFTGSPAWHSSDLSSYDARLNPYAGPGSKWSATQLAQLMAENGILSGMFNPLGSKPVMDQYAQLGRANELDAIGTAQNSVNLSGLSPEQAALARTLAALSAQSQGARGFADLQMKSGLENRQRLDAIIGQLFGYNFTPKDTNTGMNFGDVAAGVAGTALGAFGGGIGQRVGMGLMGRSN